MGPSHYVMQHGDAGTIRIAVEDDVQSVLEGSVLEGPLIGQFP